MSGVSDAIMMGYLIALIVNAQFQYLDYAQTNFNLLIDRYYQISEHPEQIIPLVFTKVEKINTYWFGFLVVSSALLHLKFSSSEMSTIGNLETLLGVMMTLLGMLSVINPIILGLIALEIINIYLALNTSEDHHPYGGAWISFEFFGLPPLGSYIHGYASSGF